MFDDIPRPTCRSVYTVSDKRLRHGGSGYETGGGGGEPLKASEIQDLSHNHVPVSHIDTSVFKRCMQLPDTSPFHLLCGFI